MTSALGDIQTKDWEPNSDLGPGTNGYEDDPYSHINNLEVATEYLSSFIQEYNSDKPPRVGDMISILKRIRVALLSTSSGVSGSGDMWDESSISSKLRKTLLELIFKLVEKNQNDVPILFWSSFVLLHVRKRFGSRVNW